MPRTRRFLIAMTAVVLVFMLVGLPGGSRSDVSVAAAGDLLPAAGDRPLGPAGLPPTDLSWFPVGLVGGPVYQIAVSRYGENGQRVAAAGNEVFVSSRGTGWSLPRDRTGPVVNVVAGPDGVMYAATAAGEGWRTTDLGRSWFRARVSSDAPVHFLAVSPDFETDKLAFGITTGDWQLYRADRGGSSWNEVIIEPDARPKYQFGAVAFSPLFATDETFFVGTDRGVFMTTDTGMTWQQQAGPDDGAPAFGEGGGPPSSQGIVIPFEYGDDPERQSDPDVRTLFAYNAQGVYRSDDNGEGWRRLPLEVTRVNGLALSNAWPNDPVLLAAVTGPNGEVGAVSDDGGDHWRLVPGQDGLVGTSAALALDFGRLPPYVDPNRGWAYLPLVQKNAEPSERTPDLRLRPPATGSREMYLSTDGAGVWRSVDAGQTWGRRSVGLANVQVTDLAFLPGGPDAHVLAATETAGLYRSINGGRFWRWMDLGLPRGADQAIYDLRLSPDYERDTTIFMAAESGVWVSSDGGKSWSRTPGPAPARALALSPAFAHDRTLVAAGNMSTDGGQAWTALPVEAEWTVAAFSPQYEENQTIWSGELVPAEGTGYTLRRSSDNGQTWEPIKHSRLRNRSILSLDVLSVVSSEPNRIFVGTERGLMVSHDGGEEWARISDMARDTYAIASRKIRDPMAGVTAIVLVAGEEGVVWSTNRGIDWSEEPEAPGDGRAAAISHDGSVMLIAPPISVARYGVGSAWIFLPVARQWD